jgi:hypothetical protein
MGKREGGDVRIVKGSPLARRILVKYTVPEPIRDEVTRKPCVKSLRTFVALRSEGEVYVPLRHAYLYPKYEDNG